MKTNNKFFLIQFIILSSVYAVSALTVSPARLELEGNYGNVTSNEFTIINEEASEQTYYTSVENFEAHGESGTPSFTASKEGFPSWVKVTDKITIKSGEKIKIPFSVRVPIQAKKGGHFAGICLSTIPPVTKGGEVSVGPKLCMLMLLKVGSNSKKVENNQIFQKATTSLQGTQNINATTSLDKDVVTINSNLKYGQRDASIYALQDFLIDKGFLTGNSSGFFGLLTFKAVKAYQKSVNISPTGYVGLITRQKINEEILLEISTSRQAELQETGTTTQVISR